MSSKKLNFKSEKSSLKLPLRLILVVPFVLQIAVAVGLTGWLSLRNGQEAVNNVTTELRIEISDRIQEEVRNYIKAPYIVNQINSDAISLGLFDIQDLQSMQKHFWQQIQAFDSIDYIQFGTAQGEFIGVKRTDNKNIQIDYADRVTRYQYQTFATDSGGNLSGLLKTITSKYDPRSQTWYKIAVENKQSTWSEIHSQLDFPKLAITAVTPVYDSGGGLLGVVGSDLTLAQINQFLNSLKIGRSGVTFIIDRSEKIVATSLNDRPFTIGADGREIIRQNATESNEPLIRYTGEYLLKTYKSLQAIDSNRQLNFELDGNRQFIQITPLNDNRGIDWLIVVVIPETDFMEQINKNTRTTILLCVVALLVATLLGLLTSSYISSKILRLSVASKAIANGKLDQNIKVEGIKELGDLAESFNQMARQLSESFTNLEKINNELQVNMNRVKETQIQLVRSEKMSALGNLVAGVGHEINNPISFLSGNINIAEEYIQNITNHLFLYQRYFPQPGYEILKNAEDIDLEYSVKDLPESISSMKIGIDRIRSISKALRTFARADTEKKVKINIHEGMDITLLILKHRLKANQKRPEIEIVKKYGNLPEVTCYPGQINQVFMNIIANAIDAFDEGNLGRNYDEIMVEPNRITIRTFLKKEEENSREKERNLEEEVLPIDNNGYDDYHSSLSAIACSEYAVISFKDNGPGIPDKVISQLFDHLFTTKPVGKGTGLGLSISRQIIEEIHGGRLYCISSIGKGAEFVIEIPVS